MALRNTKLFFYVFFLAVPLIGMAQGESSKKLSRKEKKALQFQENRDAFLKGSIRVETREVDFPGSYGRPTGGLLYSHNSRLEFHEFTWQMNTSDFIRLNEFGKIENYKVVKNFADTKQSAEISFRAIIGGKTYYFELVHTARDKIEMKIKTDTTPTYFYRGKAEPFTNF